MKSAAIIQARMGSTRLPGKVMKDLEGKTVLSHVIERIKQSKKIDEIIIATTNSKQDNVIVKEAEKNGIKVFKGSEDDVLSRYFLAAKEFNIDVVVRITSDCPLIDPHILDELISFYLNNQYEIVTNAGSDPETRSYPRGLDSEIFSFESLKNAYINGKEIYHREHVTPFIYENTQSIYYYKNGTDLSHYRWTLDTTEDFKLITEIYKKLYKGKHNFYLNEIMNLLKREPWLATINAHIEQKKVK